MTRRSKPRRACKMCKAFKYAGNGKDRRPHREHRQAGVKRRFRKAWR